MNSLNLLLVLPEVCMAAAACTLLAWGAVLKEKALSAITVSAAMTLVFAAWMVASSPVDVVYAFDGLLRFDAFTSFARILIPVGALAALVLSANWTERMSMSMFEYPVLILLATTGLMLLTVSNDFLSLYMAVELASLSLYVMAAYERDNIRSSEAGLKYFILGALASGMMLFGISLIYGFSGTTNFTVLAEWSNGDLPVTFGFLIGLVLVLVGVCFKISGVPFHMWTPDVYEGAPTAVVAYFSTVPKIAAMLLFARLLQEPFAHLVDDWQPIVIFVAMASMVVGAFGALKQKNIKRLLAYSSIGHVGYALCGLAAANEAGLQGVLIYLFLYLFMSIGAFGVVMWMSRGGHPMEEIADLSGLSTSHPRAAAFMAILMFSMAGIPPLAGFFGKFYVFLAAAEAGLYGLVVAGLLTSVVAAYYYLRIVKIMYFDEVKEVLDGKLQAASCILMFACAAVTLFFFLTPTPLIRVTEQAAAAAGL
jgi:NADH-quinone oxidoreductase subunit N